MPESRVEATEPVAAEAQPKKKASRQKAQEPKQPKLSQAGEIARVRAEEAQGQLRVPAGLHVSPDTPLGEIKAATRRARSLKRGLRGTGGSFRIKNGRRVQA